MNKKRYPIVWCLSLFLLLLIGCQNDEFLSSNSNSVGKLVPVRLNFSLPPSYVPQSAPVSKSLSSSKFSVWLGEAKIAPRSTPEVVLHNLWVLQFDAAGKKVQASKIITTNPSVNGSVIIDVELVVGTGQTIYIVALGKKIDEDLSNVATLTALEAYPISYLEPVEGGYISKITADEDMIYGGSVKNIDVIQIEEGGPGMIKYNPIGGFNGGIELKALLAKVSLHYTYSVENMKHLALGLSSVAANAYVTLDKSEKNSFKDLLPVENRLITEKDEHGRSVYTWYIAANMQGEVPGILFEKDRYSTKAPKKASFITLNAVKEDDMNTSATYSIYLGNNNTTNFDLEPASHYLIYTDVNLPLSETDNRVDVVVDAKIEVDFFSSDPLKGGGPQYDFDAHYDQRRFTITSSAHKITVQLLDENDQPLDPTGSWVKLSRSSNYTDAVRSKDLSTHKTINVIVPGKTNLYLYCDEYIHPRVYDIEDTNAPKRRVKVNITIATQESESISLINEMYFIDQRTVVVSGYWGGELDPNTGQYSRLLAVEDMEEYSTPYQKGVEVLRIPDPYFGYNGQLLSAAGYDVDNSTHGMRATISMATNVENLPVTTGISKLEEPRKNGKGDIELYQYTDIFYTDQQNYRIWAARYCYDKNRDLDGSGAIEEDRGEMKWYLPAQSQVMAFYIIRNSTRISNQVPGLSYWSTREQSANTGCPTRFLDGITRTLGKASNGLVRCVRDLDGKK